MTITTNKKILPRAQRILLALLVLAAVPTRAQDLADDMGDATMGEELPGAVEVARRSAPPPRSLDDITQALQRNKPDAQKTERDRAAAQAAPPAVDDKQALFTFYSQRSGAAARIGLQSQRIADLRLAAESAPTPDHRRQAMQLLAHAEATGGNYLNAIAINEREVNDRNARRAFSENCRLAMYRAQLGDVAEAKQNLKRCEAILARRQRRDDISFSEHLLTAHYERARVAVFAAEGKLADAETSARKAVAEMELFLPTVRARKQEGLVGNPSNLAHMRSVRDNNE